MEDGLNLVIYENVFQFADEIFKRLESEIVYLPDEQCQVRIKNKSHPISRKIVVFGDPGVTYSFSGLTLNSQPWSPLLLEIKNIIEGLAGVEFNFLLINRYADGDSCIGQHKDNEPDLDENFPICSVSFGETRTMVFKRPNYADKKIELKSNSVLLMNPPTNHLWSHGIPRQKKRTGVRINLTFRKMKTSTPENKRKVTDDMDSEGNNKKIKKDNPKDGIFKEDEIPEGMFHIGDSIFVFPKTFRGCVSVHIRRFKKYGHAFYPTAEGVTLRPHWTEYIMKPQTLPKDVQDLKNIFMFPVEEFSIDSSDFVNYTFTRFKKDQYGQITTKSIILSSSQWLQMMHQYNDIIAVLLDHIYDSMDFVSAYLSNEDRDIDESMPESLDASLGSEHLLQLLRDSLSFCVKEVGRLKDPELTAGELIANRTESFDSAALSVRVQDIAETFYGRLWECKDFLRLSTPAMYVTRKFLKEIRLKDVLREVRNILCPANAFEYFEEIENL